MKPEDVFDGKKQSYGNVVKLIEGDLNGTRTMEALEVYTEWSTGGDINDAKRVPLAEGYINIFESNQATREELEHFSDLVWADTDFGANTPKYFKTFKTAPVDKATLDSICNQQRQKHVILGNNIWNSLSSSLRSKS